MNRRVIAILFLVAAAGMLVLWLFLPSCVHPIRGLCGICGEGIHIRVDSRYDASRLCIPFWWLSLCLSIYPVIYFLRGEQERGARQGRNPVDSIRIQSQG